MQMKKAQCQLYLPRQRINEILKLIQKRSINLSTNNFVNVKVLAWSKLHSVKFILFCSQWKLKRPEIRQY